MKPITYIFQNHSLRWVPGLKGGEGVMGDQIMGGERLHENIIKLSLPVVCQSTAYHQV